MTPRRAFADLSVGQVHYATCGNEAAPAVLLLHQSPRSWAEYRKVLPLLGLRYRAIAMDTAGFGDSADGGQPASIEQWASVACELLDALGVRQADVVGHHTGGVVAIEMAAAYADRVRGLVLSSTPYTDDSFRRERAARPPIDEVSTREDGTHLAAMWQKRQAFYPVGRPDLLEAYILDALKVGRGIEDGHRAVASYRMEASIGRVKQPVLIIRATDDPFAAPHAGQLKQLLPGARVIDIDGAMVPLPDQMPEAFAQVVLDFLKTLP